MTLTISRALFKTIVENARLPLPCIQIKLLIIYTNHLQLSYY